MRTTLSFGRRGNFWYAKRHLDGSADFEVYFRGGSALLDGNDYLGDCVPFGRKGERKGSLILRRIFSGSFVE